MKADICSWCEQPIVTVAGICRVAIRTFCGDLLHLRCWLESTTEKPVVREAEPGVLLPESRVSRAAGELALGDKPKSEGTMRPTSRQKSKVTGA